MSERSVGMGGENLRRRLSNESLLLSPCKACNPKARVPEPGLRAVPSAFPSARSWPWRYRQGTRRCLGICWQDV